MHFRITACHEWRNSIYSTPILVESHDMYQLLLIIIVMKTYALVHRTRGRLMEEIRWLRVTMNIIIIVLYMHTMTLSLNFILSLYYNIIIIHKTRGCHHETVCVWEHGGILLGPIILCPK